MKPFKELIKSKSISQYIFYGVLIAALVTDVIFIAVDFGDITFTVGCFALIIIGCFLGFIDFFMELRGIFRWCASLAFIAAITFHLNAALPSLSDLWNHVNFIGGNQKAAILFGVLFLIYAVTLIVLNFFEKGSVSKLRVQENFCTVK